MFVECIEKTQFPGFGISPQGATRALRGRRRLPEEEMQLAEMQLAGPKEGGLVYTDSDPDIQNGDLR